MSSDAHPPTPTDINPPVNDQADQIELDKPATAPGVAPALQKKEWSPGKTWLMGIASALIIAVVTGVAGYVHNPPSVPDAERVAVFSLVNDLRTTPLFFRLIYLEQHNFMKARWLKESPKDAYWESVTFPANLTLFAEFVGRRGIGDPMLEPRHGKGDFTIKDIDKLKYGDGKEEYKVRAETVETPDEQNAKLDLNVVHFYSLRPSLLPPKISLHANDLSLPANVRRALYALMPQPSAQSFQKVESRKADFLLLMPDGTPTAAEEMRLTDETALYSFDGIGSAHEFVRRTVGVVEALDHWSRRYSVDLNLFVMPPQVDDNSPSK